jgi:hypothetical protein
MAVTRPRRPTAAPDCGEPAAATRYRRRARGPRDVRYAAQVPALFRRKATATVIQPDETVDTVEETTASKSRGHTQSKREQGIATPKRTSNGRQPGGGKQMTRREISAANREARLQAREAMMRGEEKHLLPRDKGPDRALVRDIVDSRRNASSYVFVVLLLILVVSTVNIPIARLAANGLFVLMLLVVIFDGFVLSRQIKRTVQQRLPKLNPRWGSLYFYAIMRAISFRRMRVPRPRVNVGDKI